MNKIYFSLSILMLFLVLSCREKTKTDNLPNDPITLEVVKTLRTDSLILSPLKLIFHNDKIIIYDAVRNGSYLKFIVFNDNLEYLYNFGEKGRAANEFGNIFFNNIISSDYLEVVDFGNMNIKYIDLGDKEAKIFRKRVIPNSVDAAPINSLRKIKEDEYFSNCITNTNNNYEILKFHLDSNGEISDISPLSKVPDWYKGELNQRFTYLAYNNNKGSKVDNKIGIFYYNYPYFRIITTKGALILENEVHINNQSIMNEETAYFFNAYATDNYIYSIWCNYSTSSPEYMKYNKILAIDWDGNIKALFELNENASSNFIVSDNDEFLYNLTNNEENPLLVKYKIPKLH